MGPAVETQTEADHHIDIALRYEGLVKKYEEMQQQVRYYREAYAILEEKFRRDKTVWMQWVAQDTARRQKSERLKAHNAALGGFTDPAIPETRCDLIEPPQITPYAAISTPTSQVAPGKHWSLSPPPTEKATSPGINSLAPSVSEIASTRIHTEETAHYDSDRTTDGEVEVHIATFSPLLNATHSSGELRESLTLPKLPAKVKAEETTQCLDYTPIYIKSEPHSPNSMLNHISFTQQSLDLDDIGYKPKTPRKRTYLSKHPLQANYEQEMTRNVSPTLLEMQLVEISKEQQNGVTEPLDPFVNSAFPASQVSVVNESESQANSQLPYPPTSNSTPTKVHQVEPLDLPAGFSATIARHGSTATIQPTGGKLARLTSQRRSKGTMLPPRGKPRGARRPRELRLLDSEIEFLTEDGTGCIDSMTVPPPTEVALMGEQTLGKLLDSPPEKNLSIAHLRKGLGGVCSRAVTPTRISNNLGDGGVKFTTPEINKQSGKHNMPITDPPISKRSKCITRAVSARGPSHSSGGGGMKGGQLRYCDAKELQASDFVINADKAYGRNYAHHEVIRKHDERKCLPGCLQPCCAGLKGFLEKAGMPVTVSNAPKWRSSPDASPSSPQCDNKEERDSSVDKAREFVNKVSRHRNLFERNNSPPGFWNSEFPSTQEVEERRKQAMESERRRVAEMKKEATKGNGRYLFRDEVRRKGAINSE